MANPADEAAVLAARANAEASRTYAKNIMGTAVENYQRFQETAEQALAARYVMYAKTGNVSTEENAVPTTGGTPVGSPTSEEWQTKKTDLQTEIDDLTKKLGRYAGKEIPRGAPPGLREEAEQLKQAQESLKALGNAPENLPTIRANPATSHLSGSDLLTEVSYRDLAQRHANTLMRTAENQAVAAETQGENFDTQADYLEAASSWETWSSILGVGMTVLGGVLSLTGMPELGIPLITAGVAQATR